MRSAGHKLVGDKGLNCVACHLFDGKSAGGLQGLDLLASYDRLKPDWFVPFMLNPASTPGIVMPSYWRDGQSTDKETLDGNATAQLQAIWHYLSYGQGAPPPRALEIREPTLRSGQAPRLSRSQSRGRLPGISVGFPKGFITLSMPRREPFRLFEREFVSVGWGGQGAGNFNPRADPFSLPRPRFSAREPKKALATLPK